MGLFTSYCTNCHREIEYFLSIPSSCKHCYEPVDEESLKRTFSKPWEVYYMKTNFELVKEFHAAFNKIPDPELPTEQPDKIRILRHNLIAEEFDEVTTELNMIEDHERRFVDRKGTEFEVEFNINKLAKELADLLYVVYGTAAAYGIPIDDVYRKVHVNNMSKLQPDGTVKYREDGKVLKPDTYVELDISKILE